MLSNFEEKLFNPSSSLDGFTFDITSISPIDKSPNYSVALVCAQLKLESTFTENAAEKIANSDLKTIIQGSKIKILKSNPSESKENGPTIIDAKVITINLEDTSGIFAEIRNITKFLFGSRENKNFGFGEFEKKFQKITEQNPMTVTVTGFSVSVLMGFLAAYFVSKVIKTLALVVGGYLLSLQALSSNGFISINWDRVKHFIWNLDLQKTAKIFGISSLGFSLGFYLGVRKELNKYF